MIKKMCNLRKMIDVKTKKIEITKDCGGIDRAAIINTEGLSDAIEKVDKNGVSEIVLPSIILTKCELHVPQQKEICLKEYLTKYNDNDKQYDNTLGSILQFNNIFCPIDLSVIKMTYMEKGRRKNVEFPLETVYNVHVQDLLKI